MKVVLLALVALLTCEGCKKKDTLVVGVDAQPGVVSQIGKIHVKATVAGAIVDEHDIVPKPGGDKLAGVESPFPFDVTLQAAAGAQADVTIEAFRAGPNGTIADKPMLVRRVVAPFAPGGPKLARLQLESGCVTGVPGFKGPACPPHQTCMSSRCIDPALIADDLEPWTAGWASVRPDFCKPAEAGAPVVEMGTGSTDFVAVHDGETLVPEKGPQGGHHLWVAVRMKNLRQTGTTVTLTGEQPGTGLKVPPTSFVFTFERDQGGFCKLYGLRFQLDNASVPVAKFLAQPLNVKVSVSDATGQTGEAQLRVSVAEHTIGE